MVGRAWRWGMCIVCIATLLLCETERAYSLREADDSDDKKGAIIAPDDTDAPTPEGEGTKSDAKEREKAVTPDPMTEDEERQAAIDKQKTQADEAKDLDADLAALAEPTKEGADSETTEKEDSENTEESADTEVSPTDEAEDTEVPDENELSRLDGTLSPSGRDDEGAETKDEPKEAEGNDEA